MAGRNEHSLGIQLQEPGLRRTKERKIEACAPADREKLAQEFLPSLLFELYRLCRMTPVQQARVPACESPSSTEVCWDWLRSRGRQWLLLPLGIRADWAARTVQAARAGLLDLLLLCALPLPCCLGAGDFL